MWDKMPFLMKQRHQRIHHQFPDLQSNVQTTRQLSLQSTVFNGVSEAIHTCYGFALLRAGIGSNTLDHFLNQLEVKSTYDFLARVLACLVSITCTCLSSYCVV